MIKSAKSVIGLVAILCIGFVSAFAYLYTQRPETLQLALSRVGLGTDLVDVESQEVPTTIPGNDSLAEPLDLVIDPSLVVPEPTEGEPAVINLDQLTEDQKTRIANGTLSMEDLRAELDQMDVVPEVPPAMSSFGLNDSQSSSTDVDNNNAMANSSTTNSNIAGNGDIQWGSPDTELDRDLLTNEGSNSTNSLNSLDSLITGAGTANLSALNSNGLDLDSLSSNSGEESDSGLDGGSGSGLGLDEDESGTGSDSNNGSGENVVLLASANSNSSSSPPVSPPKTADPMMLINFSGIAIFIAAVVGKIYITRRSYN